MVKKITSLFTDRSFQVFGCLTLLGLWLSYRQLPWVYYMHDEWRQLASVYLEGIGAGISSISWWALIIGKGRLLGALVSNIMLQQFKLNALPFVYHALVVHALNSILVYIITKKITQNGWLGVIAGIFFLSTSRTHEALSWIGASVQTLWSMFFALLSVHMALIFVEKKEKSYFIVAILLAYIGFLFKESVIFIFFLLFFLWYWLVRDRKRTHRHQLIRMDKVFSLVAIVSLIVIIFVLFGGKNANAIGLTPPQIVLKSAFNTVFYPIVSLGQFILPFRFTNRVAWFLLSFNYSFMKDDYNKESIVHFILSDMISMGVSVVILFALIVVWRYLKIYRKALILANVWYISSFVPIAFHLINRYDSYIEERYVYYPAFAVGIFMAILCGAIYKAAWSVVSKKLYILCIFVGLLLILFFKECQITYREVRVKAWYGRDMRRFISELEREVPQLPDNPVFLIESTKSYFYPENKLPFALGSGYVLSVIYFPTGKIPRGILYGKFLEEFGSQGYKRYGDTGWGFYQSKEAMEADRSTGILGKDVNVMNLSWDGEKNRLIRTNKD